jgi:hypothetical protein
MVADGMFEEEILKAFPDAEAAIPVKWRSGSSEHTSAASLAHRYQRSSA